jgi:hypothetical protein
MAMVLCSNINLARSSWERPNPCNVLAINVVSNLTNWDWLNMGFNQPTANVIKQIIILILCVLKKQLPPMEVGSSYFIFPNDLSIFYLLHQISLRIFATKGRGIGDFS